MLPAAALAATGGITGTVTAAGGGAIEGVSVCADAANFPETGHGCDATDSAGAYSIEGLPTGKYKVKFDGGNGYVDQWFDGEATEFGGDIVTVTGGAVAEAIDAELEAAAILEGTVTAAGTGTPLSGASVCAQEAKGTAFQSFCTTTDANEHYVDGGIPAANYRVGFRPGFAPSERDYLPQYFSGASTFATATPLNLAAASVRTGVDAALQPGGRIAGTVGDETGAPLKDIYVCLFPVLGAYTYNCVQTAADGTYTFHGLRSEEYKLQFGRSGPGNYLPQFYSDKSTRQAAGAIAVTAPGEVTGVDARLRSGGRIAGKITDASTSAPVQGASACAQRLGGGRIRCDSTAVDGSYEIEGLTGGEYAVELSAGGTTSNYVYLTQFYDGADDRAGATPVTVAAGGEVTGIDGALVEGATISGQVTDAGTTAPVAAIQVCALDAGTIIGHCDTSDSEGNYAVVGVPSGEYTLRFTPAGGGPTDNYQTGDPDYVTQFYDGAAEESTATKITATAGADVGGIDAALSKGGRIAGTVTGPSGKPVRYAQACVVASATDLFGTSCGASDAEGNYEIKGLGIGTYRVRFQPPTGPNAVPLAPQYYEAATDYAAAQPVSVTGPGTTSDVDAQLEAASVIEGTVTDSYDGSALDHAFVCARPRGGPGEPLCAELAPTGDYAIVVPPGSYDVEFTSGYTEEEGPDEGLLVEEFITQFFAAAPSEATATPVVIGSGETRAGVDASLSPAPAILDTLSVVAGGDGVGAVTSTPPGINCSSQCSDTFETRKMVKLAASPSAGSAFTGWSGACTGTGPCEVRLTGDADVHATFAATASASPPVATPPPPPLGGPPAPTPQPVPSVPPDRHCKKGFRTKHAGGKARCVKIHRRHGKHHRPRHHR